MSMRSMNRSSPYQTTHQLHASHTVENLSRRSGRERKMTTRKAREVQAFHTRDHNFIKNNFHYKECIRYVPNKDPGKSKDQGEIRCHCGEVQKRHQIDGLELYGLHGNSENTPWKEDFDIRLIDSTNAYGQIKFLPEDVIMKRPAEYVRISDTDDLKDVMELMRRYWLMMEPVKPSLCISVIGGAKNFKLEGRKKQVFYDGLVKAAQTTEAWIVTSGLNLGIVRVVGDALQDAQSHSFNRKSMHLRCLGVSPWGYVLNRHILVSRGASNPVEYPVSTVIKSSQPVSLNKNHTHYIFVDEGMRNRYGGSESATFRAKLEKQIAASAKDGGWEIPVVLVIVEGGHDVLLDAWNSIQQRVPIVICSGTGRASDVLHYAFNIRQRHDTSKFEDFDQNEEAELRQMLKDVSPPKRLNEAYHKLKDIVKFPQYITIFDMNKSTDFDLAILYALIKTESNMKTQLELCLRWDRVDIAEEKILNQRSQVLIDMKDLENVMLRALQQDKVEFVRLMLHSGVVMNKFLTIERLHKLYNESIRPNMLIRCINHHGLNKHLKSNQLIKKGLVDLNAKSKVEMKQEIYLKTIKSLIKRMLGRFNQEMYEFDDPIPLKENDIKLIIAINKQCFKCPFRELFLWAVLFNRHQMAKFLWSNGEDPIALALVGCKLYRSAIKALPSYDTETKFLFESYIKDFEDLAVRVLEQIDLNDSETATYLIECHTETWGRMNCLEIASACQSKVFLSSIPCQNSLDTTWCHGIQSNILSVFLGIFIPPLLLVERMFIFKYLPDDLEERNPENNLDSSNKEFDFSPFETTVILPSEKPKKYSSNKCKELTFKCSWFYTAPKTKFFLHTFFYILFLVYYSWVLLFGFIPGQITGYEAFIMVYFIAMWVDEVREVCIAKSETFGSKISNWWNASSWNQLDVVICLLALVSMLLRIGLNNSYQTALTFYAITLIFFYMRIFRLYAVNQQLGPKLVMIERMMQELLVFIFIIMIVLTSYGTARQGLLYPNHGGFNWTSVLNVFDTPYWMFYGNYDFDQIFAKSCEGQSNEFDGITCPVYNFVVPLLTATYSMIATTLLINLLIAIFSNVFQQVEDNSIEIWKFNLFSLVAEYESKTILPMPLSAVETLIELLIFFGKNCRTRATIKKKNARDLNETLVMTNKAYESDSAATFNNKFEANYEQRYVDLVEYSINENDFSMTLSDKFEPSEEDRDFALSLQRSVAQNVRLLLQKELEGSTEGVVKDIRKKVDDLSEQIIVLSNSMVINKRLENKNDNVTEIIKIIPKSENPDKITEKGSTMITDTEGDRLMNSPISANMESINAKILEKLCSKLCGMENQFQNLMNQVESVTELIINQNGSPEQRRAYEVFAKSLND